MEFRVSVLVLQLAVVMLQNTICPAAAQGESYLERYGPGSSSRDRYPSPSRDRYPEPSRDRYPSPSRDRYPEPSRDRYPSPSRDRYPEPSRDRYDDRYDNPNRGPSRGGGSTEPQKPRYCPVTLSEWERSMESCMSPLNRLRSGSAMRERCRAYKDSEPCVEGLQLCKRDNPRILYYKSEALKKWKDMEREAEVYGVCNGV